MATTTLMLKATTGWIAGKPSEAGSVLKAQTTFADEHLQLGSAEAADLLPSEEVSIPVENAMVQQSLSYASTEGGYVVTYTVDLIFPSVFRPIVPVDYAHFAGVVKISGLPAFDTIVVDTSRCLKNGWARISSSTFAGDVLTCLVEAGGNAIAECFNAAMMISFSTGLADSGRLRFEYGGSIVGVSNGQGPNVRVTNPPAQTEEFEFVSHSDME